VTSKTQQRTGNISRPQPHQEEPLSGGNKNTIRQIPMFTSSLYFTHNTQLSTANQEGKHHERPEWVGVCCSWKVVSGANTFLTMQRHRSNWTLWQVRYSLHKGKNINCGQVCPIIIVSLSQYTQFACMTWQLTILDNARTQIHTIYYACNRLCVFVWYFKDCTYSDHNKYIHRIRCFCTDLLTLFNNPSKALPFAARCWVRNVKWPISLM
jgi:hypothetical protein